MINDSREVMHAVKAMESQVKFKNPMCILSYVLPCSVQSNVSIGVVADI